MNKDRSWFSLVDGQIKGPFSTAQVEGQLSQLTNALIWGRGMTEWMNPTQWQTHVQTWTEETPQKEEDNRMWRLNVAGQEMKPMSYDDMIAFLKKQNNVYEIKLWTDGYPDWKDVYQIHRIMDQLGVSRRSHPRVPIMGTVTCQTASVNFEGKLQSISEGGLGAVDAHGLKIGEKTQVTIKSPNLIQPIKSTAEVVFVGSDGYIALKFLQLQTESQSIIIEYINKFTGQQTQPS